MLHAFAHLVVAPSQLLQQQTAATTAATARRLPSRRCCQQIGRKQRIELRIHSCRLCLLQGPPAGVLQLLQQAPLKLVYAGLCRFNNTQE